MTTATGAPPPVLEARGIAKSYGSVTALRSASISVAPQEVHALIGDNGAGKSTLIKVLSGTVIPDRGTISVDGQPVVMNSPTEAKALGIETVYQDLALADSLDAAQNIFLGRELMRPGIAGALGFYQKAKMRETTRRYLKDLGITLPSIDAPVGGFSGGQRQAVAVARAAVWAKRLIILDEAMAALGHVQTGHVLDMVARTKELGLSVILISHNMPEVLRVADRITVLRLGETALTVDAKDADTDLLVAAMTGSLKNKDKPRGDAR
ncbi:MAG: ATP-binding cassette domain-containing protein [Protaetiibacter sp.]